MNPNGALALASILRVTHSDDQIRQLLDDHAREVLRKAAELLRDSDAGDCGCGCKCANLIDPDEVCKTCNNQPYKERFWCPTCGRVNPEMRTS